MSTLRKVTALTAATALAITLAGCGKSSSESSSSTSSTTASGTGTKATVTTANTTAVAVNIANFAFSPATLTIKAGQTVTWTNNDSATHTVTSGTNRTFDGKYDKSLKQGESWSHTYSDPGTYEYYCKPHTGMTGKVIVQ